FRELRPNRFVSPVAEPTLDGDAKKDVGPSRPRAVLEPSLNDDVRAFAHRGERLVECVGLSLSISTKRLPDPLVNQTTPHRRTLAVPARAPSALERQEVATREEIGQVRSPRITWVQYHVRRLNHYPLF